MTERILECGGEFYEEMQARGVKKSFDRIHLGNMLRDEDDEYYAAEDVTEQVDALLDGAFYCADSLARPGATAIDDFWIRKNIDDRLRQIRSLGIDPAPLIEIVHAANMTKFTLPGGRLEGGKWMKPPAFMPPDALLRAEINRQLEK